jgi:mannose/fructose-specific phosphotransferase system component IIA
MVKIIVAAHCDLAFEFVDVIVAISGNQANLYFVELESNNNFEQMRLRIFTLLGGVSDKDGVLILADMFGSIPCNACYSRLRRFEI